jgi:hypothetical protein
VQRCRVPIVAVLSAVMIAVSAAPAASQDAGRRGVPRAVATRTTVGRGVARDVSFPQCGGSLPRASSAVSGVLGTNNGISFTRNPCLVAELRWAKRLTSPPAFYANTGNPGPQRSKHWPIGQTTPYVCASADPNSIGCSYDYGWNAAKHSFATAADAARRLHRVDHDNAHRRAANVEWWLDVETMNSWQAIDGKATLSAFRRDVATLLGEVAALRHAGVAQVGIYSTPYQWKLITGGSAVTRGRFATAPQWLAGFESHADAVTGCARRGFTGGPVRMTQYLAHDGFDANVLCTAGDG